MPATVALKMSGVSFIFYFSEIASDPIEIACAHWPEAVPLGDVRTLGLGWLDKAVAKHPGALLWFTGGIPCKDVSQLNARRNGAPGKHSCLHGTVREIPEHLFKLSKNAVCTLECTRMDDADRRAFSESLGSEPLEINDRGWSPLSRPRWWWITGKDPLWPKDTEFGSFNGLRRVRPHRPTVTWEPCFSLSTPRAP